MDELHAKTTTKAKSINAEVYASPLERLVTASRISLLGSQSATQELSSVEQHSVRSEIPLAHLLAGQVMTPRMVFTTKVDRKRLEF